MTKSRGARTVTVIALLLPAGCEPSRAPVEPAAIAVVPAAASSAPPQRRTVPVAVASADPEPSGEVVKEGAPLPAGDASVGVAAPGFVLDDLLTSSGKATLQRGNVTVIHFWATWCEPCKRTFPVLEKLYKAKKREGLTVIAISVDDEVTDVAAFARSYAGSFPVAWDKGHKVTTLYHLQMMPTTFVIDRTGTVRYHHPGFHAGEDVTISDEVQSLL